MGPGFRGAVCSSSNTETEAGGLLPRDSEELRGKATSSSPGFLVC